MNRALSFVQLTCKAQGRDHLTVEGIASTPKADRVGDVLEPMGCKFALPLPLLFSHDSKDPVGQVVDARPTPEGIRFTATIPFVKEPGTLKDRLDNIVQSLRAGLFKGVSVGFSVLDSSPLRGGGILVKAWEWIELSICSIPCNPQATITALKSLDGIGAVEQKREPGKGSVKLIPASYRW